MLSGAPLEPSHPRMIDEGLHAWTASDRARFANRARSLYELYSCEIAARLFQTKNVVIATGPFHAPMDPLPACLLGAAHLSRFVADQIFWRRSPGKRFGDLPSPPSGAASPQSIKSRRRSCPTTSKANSRSNVTHRNYAEIDRRNRMRLIAQKTSSSSAMEAVCRAPCISTLTSTPSINSSP